VWPVNEGAKQVDPPTGAELSGRPIMLCQPSVPSALLQQPTVNLYLFPQKKNPARRGSPSGPSHSQ